jgi:hypothetical protein
LNFTVHRLEPPELNELGLQVRAATPVVGATIRESCWEDPLKVAVRVVVRLAVTAVAVAAKVADADPAATVTDTGTVTTELLSETDTLLPPEGAGWFKVTVQVLERAAVIALGLHVSADTSVGTTRFKTVVWEAPFNVAVTLTL